MKCSIKSSEYEILRWNFLNNNHSKIKIYLIAITTLDWLEYDGGNSD